jgi:hypothetical protein
VKVGTFVLRNAVGPNDLDATAARDAAPGVSWSRFEATMLYWTADDERWPAAQQWADTAGWSWSNTPGQIRPRTTYT